MAHKLWRVTFNWSATDGNEEVQSFHILDTTPLEADLRSAGAVAELCDDWLSTLLRACAPSYLSLDSVKATSVVKTWDGEIAEAGQHIVGLAGTASGGTGQVPRGTCIWSKASVNEVYKGNHGGWHSPDDYNSADLNANGQWINTGYVWIAVGNVNSALLSGHDYLVGLGHLSYVLYSMTRHKRGEANYYFDVVGLQRDPVPHFLRTRLPGR